VRTLGVDHTSAEVYADVLRMKTFRSVLAVAVHHHNVKIDHWDLKTAFLNAPMTKLVYAMQPPGYEQIKPNSYVQ
jgi:predicted alternative tryptophan synthase beta-subunit